MDSLIAEAKRWLKDCQNPSYEKSQAQERIEAYSLISALVAENEIKASTIRVLQQYQPKGILLWLVTRFTK